MNICNQCQQEFPNRIIIDGKPHNLHKRKYCLDCSPFGLHNTKKLDGEPRKDQHSPKCACGETDPTKFYGNKRTVCAECHKQYTLAVFRKKKEDAIVYKGGSCSICGYDKYSGALEFHHIDPNDKDEHFTSMRHWRWERMRIELDKCVLLCSNCHREVHAGIEEIT